MATTAIWDVTDRLKRVLNYAVNPDKTDQGRRESDGLQEAIAYMGSNAKTERQLYVRGINCDPGSAYEQMQRSKKQFQKTGGIVAFHGYQSFAPGETTPELAHAIGVKLAQMLWGERFEVVVATHVDKDHLHNHFVLNSVSFMDGKRYYDNKVSYSLMRQTSDQLCREHALSVIEQPERGRAMQYGEWRADQERKPTWRGVIREDVDSAIAAARTMSQFYAALQEKGYDIKAYVKHLAIRPHGKTRFVRLRSLGEAYTETAIKQRILDRTTAKRLPLPQRKRAVLVRRNHFDKTRKLSGLQALYVRYLYVLGILPRYRSSPRRTFFLLREDLHHLSRIIEQTKLLCRQHISSREQLTVYWQQLLADVHQISGVRKVIYNRLRRCRQPEQIAAYREQIASYSRQLAQLRKEVRLCKGILSRSYTIKDKLQQQEEHEEKSRRKEVEAHERKRGGRSGRQHESARD
ncbi:relaxase/mobilization nuclease domain-containing protein [Paenibacillus sp. J5C_2022]|uniref:relaxase/mobilization nuclease domain-containing protein n=1 Tax=Paenibacillus sp. J5C2022 TaxID=2977129 RepID=UPI0021D351B4|nr:relaxase/mobilization nuclease domain-containing protein [Paenibacillus sp. J5C2022]MCU6708038.1 relaxase/mobilization nuclease domain-containing protein [Paenibacillus sp. J5C2022]